MQKNNPLEKNLLICGDNLNALDDLIKKGIQADLIYLDPPFFSNRHYEVIWGDEAEVRSFKDRWEGGMGVYIGWMKERVERMHDVLKDTGSLYLHCDSHASHYLKIMLDEVFGYSNFRNEIVWFYKRWSASANRFQGLHDVVFFYTKSAKNIHTFHLQLVPYTEKTNKRWKGQRMHNLVTAEGKLLKTPAPDEEAKGANMGDVWEISILNSQSNERLGYPTQKPAALLERIIESSSNKGDLVLDPFCGCGTALAVAQRLKREWIGIDISPTSVKLVEKRVEKLGAIKNKDFEIIGMPTTISGLRKLEPFEFQNWVINEMKAKQSRKLTSDFGLDGFYDKTIFTEKAGIQVKQSENVGRNVVDNFETALSRGKFAKGFIVAFSFTRGAHEEAARAKGEGVEIRLIEAEDLLLGKVKI